jgi:hypothetical protein
MHNFPLHMLYPVLNRQTVALVSVADMCSRLGLHDQALELARRAVQKTTEMGRLLPDHNDYEGMTQSRIRAMHTLARYLHARGDRASRSEAKAFVTQGADMAAALYEACTRECTKSAKILVEVYVSLLSMSADSTLTMKRTLEKTHKVILTAGLHVDEELQSILNHYDSIIRNSPSFRQ